ncbi:hypothetical protein [Solibacillus sp.]|uniref:hypothetical protein n=1 Tax=Solibacillus sp. TaxID=1909654 RepID=UPI003315D612
MESRNEKFRRIAQNRLTRVFTTMTLVGNLSNKRYYDYTDDEVNEIFEAYKLKGQEIHAYFANPIEKKELTNQFIFESDNTINNEKNDKFREMAQSRLSKVFVDMNLLANLSNRNNYSFKDEEIIEMFGAYQEKGIETKGRFIVRNSFTFTL